MTSFILFGSFFLFMALSIPIAISLGLAGLITAIYSPNISITFLTQGLVTSTDNFALMAIPFFILAGEIMGRGGISTRLFNLANVFVGRYTGGFAIAAVITCMFFAAISGSGPATVAAVGGIMIPAMVAQGYDRKFATSVIVTAGSMGIIIPPSIPMVLYGISSNQSIGDLFMGGIIPGLLIGICLIAWCYFYSKKKGYSGTNEKFTFKKLVTALNDAKWSLLVPVIILGGIYGGIFTPTEAAVFGVVYAAFVSFFLHKEIKMNQVRKIIADAAMSSVAILIIIGTANTFGTILTMEKIPQALANAFLSLSENSIVIILLIIVMLLMIGCFIDTSAAVIIFTPILFPVAMQIGLDPIHFGIIMIVTLSIGFITPPLGVNLFVGAGISGLSMPTLVRGVVPFFFVMLVSLAIIAIIPQLTLLLL
ncbi:C4-dicarboxylate ABC transporter permease [Alkalihalophilus pseudofirmus]|uniref:TRAP transporter large permease n=1 Tax=Alkalihalobacterium alkalinitrilicum TaxID=427920 RepID=UPI00094D4502|nr:TRAP transporter large permease [Alkalihalobacterium alkalinitrilicum]OLO27884.1 C4-dicarboxylate ABC transporter permease [Alkalihalophilus pseudofirmus]